jgi:hypothetical protein
MGLNKTTLLVELAPYNQCLVVLNGERAFHFCYLKNQLKSY